MTVAQRLAQVRARIDGAARRAGRDPEAVHVLAVTKKQPVELVREAIACGARDLGESYVQELVARHRELGDSPDLCWHFVGHLQTNKAKDVARIARVVHSVDSARLAHELGRRASADAGRLDVFLQVNVGGEAQKSGCAPAQAKEVLAAIELEPSLRVRGLMTVPPHTDDPEGARPFFRALRELRDALGGSQRLPDLSMGMSHDLEVAVEEGATWLRIGTAIFGERP
ncbi:MAG: YggS family pyridoxal phosphate-dependent enzyme [Deltaproteobacteria bacterium]|nr:YggS family pyridoxal phosphate-dependent enzyme [Deltaproteobacteria bacterium]